MIPNIGLPEIIIVLVIALVIFGPKRLPGLGRSLGSGLREFKDSVTGNGSEERRGELTERAEGKSADSPTVAAENGSASTDADSPSAADVGAEESSSAADAGARPSQPARDPAS